MRDDVLEEIRQRVSIVDLVSQRVALKQKGKVWKGLCPFHEDRNPSFDVSPEIGRYRCWACGEKGDIFNWVMKTQNVEFGEALRILARQAGVELKASNPEAASQRERRVNAMQAAQRFFVQALQQSAEAKAYLERRGLDEETVRLWGLGYAPDIGEALASRLSREGFSLAECRELFLVDQDAGGGYYDRFRGRLMFPIRDERGELVAFGGRVLGDAHPKYINSGDTPIYKKSRVLYGLDRAKNAIVEMKSVVLVEGYLDVIACHLAGQTNAVASLGTSLTDEQGQLLKRWTQKAVVLYDADNAGQKAAVRALEILQPFGFDIRFALMPQGQDPDTLLRQSGPAAVRAAVTQGLSPLEYRIRTTELEHTPEDSDFWREIIAALAESDSLPEVERWTAEIAVRYLPSRDKAGAEAQIRQQVQAVRRAKSRGAKPSEAKGAVAISVQDSWHPLEKSLIRGFCQEATRSQAWKAIVAIEDWPTKSGSELANAIRIAFAERAPSGPPVEWLHEVDPESLRDRLSDLILQEAVPLTAKDIEDARIGLEAQRQGKVVQSLKSGDDDDRLRQIQEALRAKKALEAQRDLS